MKPEGKKISFKDLCIKAIELNPTEPLNYSNLACILEKDEFVVINDKKMGVKELCLKGIELGAKDAWLYSTLACMLEKDETVLIDDETVALLYQST